MKKYMAPEMEMLDFIIDKSIAGSILSIPDNPETDPDYNNDAEFPW